MHFNRFFAFNFYLYFFIDDSMDLFIFFTKKSCFFLNKNIYFLNRCLYSVHSLYNEYTCDNDQIYTGNVLGITLKLHLQMLMQLYDVNHLRFWLLIASGRKYNNVNDQQFNQHTNLKKKKIISQANVCPAIYQTGKKFFDLLFYI